MRMGTPLGLGLTDKRHRDLGVVIWNSHHEAIRGLCCDIERFDWMHQSLVTAAAADHGPVIEPFALYREAVKGYALYSWVHCGAQTISLSDKLARAFLLTSVGTDVSDIRLPWGAFVVRIPSGVLNHPCPDTGAPFWITRLWVTHSPPTHMHDLPTIAVTFSNDQMTPFGSLVLGADGLLFDFYKHNDMAEIVHQVRRLIAGVTFYMLEHHSTDVRDPSRCSASRKRGDPWHRIIHLAPPRIVDCEAPPAPSGPSRQTGSGSVLSVQTLTRGHWRRWPNSDPGEQRRLWIQPYWRGPEEAPIQTRDRQYL